MIRSIHLRSPRLAEGRLTRWTIDLADQTNRAKRVQLDDLNSEFPRCDERFAGLPYRHGWYMANIDSGNPLLHNAGDGYIIVLVYRAATNTSELLILNAQDIAGEP